jgi:hypothetical protein
MFWQKNIYPFFYANDSRKNLTLLETQNGNEINLNPGYVDILFRFGITIKISLQFFEYKI